MKLIKGMSQTPPNSLTKACPKEEQDLLPLERVQITNSLPVEAQSECLHLFGDLLRQVILDQNTEL